MTDSTVGKIATGLAALVIVAGIVLPQVTPASTLVSFVFGGVGLALLALWIADA
jgi:hypothetical protein